MWNTVLSQSSTDRLWCGQNEKWWIMGRAEISLGRKDPRCQPRPHVALRLHGTRLKADELLAIGT